MMIVVIQIVSTVKGQLLTLVRWLPQDLGVTCETPCIGPSFAKKQRGTFCRTLFFLLPIFTFL